MNYIKYIVPTFTHAALITVLVSALPVAAEDAQGQAGAIATAMVIDVDGKVEAVDIKTREIGLGSGIGLRSTVFVPKGINIDDITVGDHLKGTYVTATETDLRAPPTAEELADPWEVIEESVKTGSAGQESIGVRAVVTIVAVDTGRGMIVVTDSRAMTHFIANVEAEKLAGLTAGQKVVVEFTEAMALTLEKSP
jgi:hypothetical protein